MLKIVYATSLRFLLHVDMKYVTENKHFATKLQEKQAAKKLGLT